MSREDKMGETETKMQEAEPRIPDPSQLVMRGPCKCYANGLMPERKRRARELDGKYEMEIQAIGWHGQRRTPGLGVRVKVASPSCKS